MGYVSPDLQQKYFSQFMSDPNGKGMYFDDWLRKKGYMGSSTPAPAPAPTPAPTPTPNPAPGASTAPSTPAPTSTPTPASSQGFSASDIQKLIQQNANAWNSTTDQATRDRLHAQNIALGNLIGASYDSSGNWKMPGVGNITISPSQIQAAMQKNSDAWNSTSDQTARDQLHSENDALGNLLGGQYNPATGDWSFGNGSQSGGSSTPAPAQGTTPPAQAGDQQPPWLKALMDKMAGQNSTINDILKQFLDNQSQSKTYSDQLFQKFSDAISQMNNQSDTRWQQYQDLAKQQADAEAKAQMDAINNMINQTKTNQQGELNAQTQNLNSAKQSLEDQTFQKWLGARQDLANRGVLGSGLRDAAQTQLMLGNNRALADLYGKTQNAITNINSKYGNQLTDAQNKLAQVNPALLQQENFQKLFEAGNKSLGDQAKIFADLIGKTLPYSDFKPGDLLKYGNDALNNQGNLQYKYDNMTQKGQQFYDKLNAQDKQYYAGLQFKYDNLSSQEQQAFDKLNSEDQRFYAKLKQDGFIDMTKIMGYDPSTGQPTLDFRKYTEQVRSNLAKEAETNRHDLVSEAVSKQNAATNAGRLAEQVKQNQYNAGMDALKLQNTQWKEQGDMLYNVVKATGTKVDELMKIKTSDGYSKLSSAQKAEIDASLKAASQDHDTAVLSLKELSKALPPSSTDQLLNMTPDQVDQAMSSHIPGGNFPEMNDVTGTAPNTSYDSGYVWNWPQYSHQ